MLPKAARKKQRSSLRTSAGVWLPLMRSPFGVMKTTLLTSSACTPGWHQDPGDPAHLFKGLEGQGAPTFRLQ